MSTVPKGNSISVDSAVQRTNDDSVVSKRSAVYKGYFDDPYLRFFVKKLSRRSPLINRGYYLRMLVITDVVERCIRHLYTVNTPSSKDMSSSNSTSGNAPRSLQVISLGAGYDTLALRLKQMPEYSDVHFYEVDFPAVMLSKSVLISASPAGSFPDDIVANPSDELVKIRGKNYRAIGADLRDTDRDLVTCLKESSCHFSTENPTVVYAECVMQYMSPDASSDLVRLIANTFSCAIFVAYDQIHPSDSFGGVMVSALRSKCSPLLSIQDLPNGAAMTRRALDNGMRRAQFADFHCLSRFYISEENETRVDSLEPFDEWEEWCEMCEHYGITLATTSPRVKMLDHPCFNAVRSEADAHLTTTITSYKECGDVDGTQLEKWPTGRFGFEGWGNGGAFAEKLFNGDVLIVSFGGFSISQGHQRTNVVHVHSMRAGDRKVLYSCSSVEPQALVFHSISRISRGHYIVFGGRTNPQDVVSDVYSLRLELPSGARNEEAIIMATWAKLKQTGENDKLPIGRYRHAATTVGLSDEDENNVVGNIFVFGGRCTTGEFLNDAWLGKVVDGAICWKCLPLSGDIPSPRCSSAMIAAENGSVVLLSGGLVRGCISDDTLWRIDWFTGVCSKLKSVVGPRFSHTMCRVRVNSTTRVLVMGGSSSEPSAVLQEMQMLLLDSSTGESIGTVKVPTACPTWTRHSCVALEDGVVAVVGGGFTCFSFGTYAAKPHLILLGNRCDRAVDYSWVMSKAERGFIQLSPPAVTAPCAEQRHPVEMRTLSGETFLALVNQPTKPVVFRNVDIGPCVNTWCDPTYLKRAEGNTRVSIHVARKSPLLDFVTKNFSFQHVSFSDLLDHCVAASDNVSPLKVDGEAETWYLRAVAHNMKSERANIWRDFRGLKNDFKLPPETAEHIEPRMHQACLRVSAPPLQLWTHYDTLDNILCQVVGRKRVILFPPSEYNNLYVTGSSSAVTSVDAPDYARFPRFVDASRRALEVQLGPGDMLFIPALWFHHITTLEGSYSISVNVFFERLPHADYDKKDLYGNKDLPAASRLRFGIVKKVKEMVSEAAVERTSEGKPLPPDMVEFALRQALQDLMEVADNMSSVSR